MNILYLAQDVTPGAQSGDATHVREVVKHLSSKHKIFLIGRDFQGKERVYDELKTLKGNKRISLHLLKARYKLSYPPIKNILTIKEGLKILKTEDIDLIYSRSLNCWVELLLGKLYSIPVVLEINGIPSEERELLPRKKAHKVQHINWIENMVTNCSIKYPKRIIAVTKKIADYINATYGISNDKLVLISNGVDVELFKPQDKKDIKDKLKIGEDYFVVTFVGSLNPLQDLECLINATPEVVKIFPNTIFLIVGEGIMKNTWKKAVMDLKMEKDFLFTDFVPYHKVPDYINISDICISPASQRNVRNKLTGGSSLKIFEYLACEKPVITGNLEGDKDIILEANAGIVIKPEKSREFSNAIIKLLKNDVLRDEMGKNGRKVVIEKYSWKIVAKRVERVCEDAVT